MNIKVHGGTRCHSDEPLCNTCSHSRIIRGRTLNEEIVDCHATAFGHRRITFHVTFCSSYNDARLPSMMQLMENAWILRKGSKNRPAGFIHGKELRMEEMSQLMTGGDDDDDDR